MNAIVMVEPAFGIIPMNLITVGKYQPRQRFSEEKLKELADSMKQNGLLQPILVRPIPNVEGELASRVEIVAGERRFRAAQILEWDAIHALVKDLTDREAAELRLIENLQREDVHPIEEAEGYERLMQDYKLNADQVAVKVGKSRSYIYGRLKFCALTPAVRAAFYEGKLNASTALLVARIPVPLLQDQAAKEISSWNGGDPMSYRAAVRHVQSRYMLELASAPFSINDIKLVPAAGSCDACPKRTGNQPEMFADIESADVCIDPDCFELKSKAHHELILRAAQKKGIPVFERESKEAPGRHDDKEFIAADAGLWRFDRITADNRNRSIDGVLKPEELPEPNSYLKTKDGEMVAVYSKTAIEEALEKAGLRLTLEQHNKAMQANIDGEGQHDDEGRPPSQKEIERQAQLAEIQRRVEAENNIRLAIYKDVREYADTGFSRSMLQILVKLMLNHFSLPDDVIGDVYKFDTSSDESIAAHIDAPRTEHAELEQILMDLLIGDALAVSSWEIEHQNMEDSSAYRALLDLAKVAGIDPDYIRKEITEKAEQPPAEAEALDQVDNEGAARDESTPDELHVGDRIRIKKDAKSANGKAIKSRGKDGTIDGIAGDFYIVKVGEGDKATVAYLSADQIEKLETAQPADTAAGDAEISDDGEDSVATKKPAQKRGKAAAAANKALSPEAAWPFSTGAKA